MRVCSILTGIVLGIMIPVVPYVLTDEGRKSVTKLKKNICKVGTNVKSAVQEMNSNSVSLTDGALETVSEKIDDIIDDLEQINLGKGMAKSKSALKAVKQKLTGLKNN